MTDWFIEELCCQKKIWMIRIPHESQRHAEVDPFWPCIQSIGVIISDPDPDFLPGYITKKILGLDPIFSPSLIVTKLCPKPFYSVSISLLDLN